MTKEQTQLQQMLAGAQKDIPATSMVAVDGEELKQSDLVAKLQGWIQLYGQLDAAKAAAGTAAQALKAAGITQFRVSLGQALRQVFGKSSPLLADFGLDVPQRKVPTTETRILAKAKSAATRAARKTMGSVQKKAVKGLGVMSVTVSPNAETSVVSAGSQPELAASSTATATPQAVGSPIADPGAGAVPIGGGGK
jgi:cob(I)alamin adenosyltransferase